MADTQHDTLSAPYTLQYAYKRALGPVLGRFLTGLRDGQILGVRTRDGRIMVPPAEYDPETSEPLSELVAVGETGVVMSWCWVAEPRRGQPLQHPFAFALVKLDGADTPMLHAVDGGGPQHMRTGMRVKVRWQPERVGRIEDIACFEPVTGEGGSSMSEQPKATEPADAGDCGEPITLIKTPMRLDFRVAAGSARSRFLRGLLEQKILGERCVRCRKVYVPPKGACPTCGISDSETVELGDHGTVTTFALINIPFDNQAFQLPYGAAAILLDGADLPLLHLLNNVPVEEIRMGLRVKAVWGAEPKPTLETIKWFEASGQPDAEYDSYKEHL